MGNIRNDNIDLRVAKPIRNTDHVGAIHDAYATKELIPLTYRFLHMTTTDNSGVEWILNDGNDLTVWSENQSITQDQSNALDNANSPEASNPFATMDDVGGASGEASNITVTAKFDNIFGNFVNSYDTPITTPIVHTLTDALNGAIAIVHYQAATLEFDNISDIEEINQDLFVANEKCKVFMYYNKGNGKITVNVYKGEVAVNARPVITMLGTTPVNVIENDTYNDAGATATDVEDGDITADIVTVNNVNTAVIGAYSVTYNVVDSEGLAAIEVVRVVNVTSSATPVPDAPISLVLTEGTI